MHAVYNGSVLSVTATESGGSLLRWIWHLRFIFFSLQWLHANSWRWEPSVEADKEMGNWQERTIAEKCLGNIKIKALGQKGVGRIERRLES